MKEEGRSEARRRAPESNAKNGRDKAQASQWEGASFGSKSVKVGLPRRSRCGEGGSNRCRGSSCRVIYMQILYNE